MELRACKKCSLVDAKVALYYHEAKWSPAEYLCVKCQKNAFRLQIRLMLVVIMSYKDRDRTVLQGRMDNFQDQIVSLAKKNKITADYCHKMIAHELGLATGQLCAASENPDGQPKPDREGNKSSA